MQSKKLILDECIMMGGLSINLMHDNKTKELYIVIEDDEGDLLLMEVKTYGEKSKG